MTFFTESTPLYRARKQDTPLETPTKRNPSQPVPHGNLLSPCHWQETLDLGGERASECNPWWPVAICQASGPGGPRARPNGQSLHFYPNRG